MRHGPGRGATHGPVEAEGVVLRAEVAPDLELELELAEVGDWRSWRYVVRGHLKVHVSCIYIYIVCMCIYI